MTPPVGDPSRARVAYGTATCVVYWPCRYSPGGGGASDRRAAKYREGRVAPRNMGRQQPTGRFRSQVGCPDKREKPLQTTAPPPGMSREEWEGYLRGWRRRLAQEEQALKARREQALSALPALVEILRQYGATEVYLFGSLRTGVFHQASDIDLGVRGIPPERFFAALAALDAACDIPVDVVDLDEVSAALRRRILEEGQRLL